MKFIKNSLFVILCIFLFTVSFGISAFSKFSTLIGFDQANYTLQGETAAEALAEDEYTKEIVQISYIDSDNAVENRPIVIYRPVSAKGEIPLIYVPHYAAEENSTDFQSYIRHGWACASPAEFKNEYNGLLVTDDLVFNNAALYYLRHADGIDTNRIAVVGGSAGGYMTLMLNELQMGTCASIANSPITNVYFNFHIHFLNCDELNRSSGLFDFPLMVQGMVSKLFRPINDKFTSEDDPLWEAVSPVSMARCFSNPTVINHFTSDVLVPVDQITKRYTYDKNDGTLPTDFTCRMKEGYPGILSKSLEEEADEAELFMHKYELENNHVDMDMPYSDKLLTINIYDDGPIGSKSSHASITTTGNYDIIPYLEDMFSRSLSETEQLLPEKLILLLERYCGISLALPAHEGIDDTVYGSLAVYQQEIADELKRYASNRSVEEIDHVITEIINGLDNEKELNDTWLEIKDEIVH